MMMMMVMIEDDADYGDAYATDDGGDADATDGYVMTRMIARITMVGCGYAD